MPNDPSLEQFELLHDLTDQERAALGKQARTRHFQKQASIYRPGDASKTIYFLIQEHVKQSYLDSSGRRLILRLCDPGDSFGENALVRAGRRRHLAETLEDVEVYAIDRNSLLEPAKRNPAFAFRVAQAIDRYLEDIETQFEAFVFKNLTGRLCYLLDQLAQRYGRPTEEGVVIEIDLIHQEISELVGSARESTSTVLSHLAAEGLIETGRNKLVIRDPETLRRSIDS